jgi:hypothetical protein
MQVLLRLKKLATCTEKEILALHGMGKSSIPKLKAALKEKGLDFRTASKKPKSN